VILLLRLTFIYNLFLQFFDAVLTYQALSRGVPEANPLVNAAISEWGVVWALLYWKTLACVLLLLIFVFGDRRKALTIRALTLTASVYSVFSAASLYEALLRFGG
jgi:Domain of unknown function (DUF5658)